jgi:hypothetical protein
MIEKAFAQVGEIPVGVSGRSDTLIDLHYMDGRPRDIRHSQYA